MDPSKRRRHDNRQERNFRAGSRQERRSSLGFSIGDSFNPFSLFDGALLPSEILRSPDLTPSEKLVFARLMQFAGGKGRAWPSIERVADEVALSVAQTRRCIATLESKGLIRRVARSGRSNEFEFLWHAIYEQEPRSPMIAVPRSCNECPTPRIRERAGAIVYDHRGAITGDWTGTIIGDRQKRIN